MENNVLKWIVQWFKENAQVSVEDIERKINDNYFAEGWIDSLTFISLISDAEDEFNINFSNDEFQDRSFSTIMGMSKIIEGKIK